MTIFAGSLAYSDIIIPLQADTAAAAEGFDSTLPAFGADSVLRADIAIHSRGVKGTAQPYSIRNDNNLTITLLAALMLMLVAMAVAKPVIGQKLKEFFSNKSGDDAEAGRQPFFVYLMAAINCLLLAVMTFVLASRTLPENIVERQHLAILAMMCATFIVYFVVKAAVYALVNIVFFGARKSKLWNSCSLAIINFEALLFMPIVMLLVFFNLSTKIAVIGILSVLFLTKILSFYKAWNIFFKEKRACLQIFLYFCALEIMPLLVLGGEVLIIVNKN